MESICDDPEIILQNIKVRILWYLTMYNVYSTEYIHVCVLVPNTL